MRLRLTGTQAECDRFVAELVAATAPGVVREVSDFYPNRGTTLLGRVYLELALPALADSDQPDKPATAPHRPGTMRRQALRQRRIR